MHRHSGNRTWRESAAHSHPGHRITLPRHLRRRSRGCENAYITDEISAPFLRFRFPTHRIDCDDAKETFILLLAVGLAGTGLLSAQSPSPAESPSPVKKFRAQCIHGGKYSNQVFTAFIPSGTASQFTDAAKYEGRRVSISGKITLCKGKAEIVNSRSQIVAKQ